MRARRAHAHSFRTVGLLLVLLGILPTAVIAQSSDPRPTPPDTNIYEQRTYGLVNGVPVKQGWILTRSEWPKQPHLGEITYTPWGAPRMFWLCVDFPHLGKNSTICSYTDIIPYPPPTTVPEIPGTREWYCTWSTNILVYSAPFNIGVCGWQNPSKGIREGSFKYTDQAGANALQQAIEVMNFMEENPGTPGEPEPDPELQALDAYLDRLIDKINKTTRWRVMAEERGITNLTEDERLRLLNLLKADASCQMISQEIRQHQIDGLENLDVFMVSSAEVYLELLRFGPASKPTTLVLDIAQIAFRDDNSEHAYILDTVRLQKKVDKTSVGKALSVSEQGFSLVANTNEAVRSYKAMLQDGKKIGELRSAHQIRCSPVGNQSGGR